MNKIKIYLFVRDEEKMANELCMHFTDTTEQINIPGSLTTIRHNNIDMGDKA